MGQWHQARAPKLFNGTAQDETVHEDSARQGNMRCPSAFSCQQAETDYTPDNRSVEPH
jgi:hypothetical protein